MGTQLLDRPVQGDKPRAGMAKSRVGEALDSLCGQSRALASFSLVGVSPTRCCARGAWNFIAEKRMAPPVFH